jgi:peptidoglycan-associated lipoprotein
MSEFWRRVAITLTVVLLVASVLSGCGGKDKQPTDLMDQPPAAGEGTGTTGSDLPPPPPPAPGSQGYGEGEETSAGGAGASGAAAGTIEFEDVQFEFDRYNLTPEALQILARNARVLEQHGDLSVIIEGHCDERGTIEYNLALGEKRAGAVKDYLVRYGIAEGRMRSISYGEERPLDRSATEEAWAKNRRAHIRER